MEWILTHVSNAFKTCNFVFLSLFFFTSSYLSLSHARTHVQNLKYLQTLNANEVTHCYKKKNWIILAKMLYNTRSFTFLCTRSSKLFLKDLIHFIQELYNYETPSVWQFLEYLYICIFYIFPRKKMSFSLNTGDKDLIIQKYSNPMKRKNTK